MDIVPYFDAHCDTLYRLTEPGAKGDLYRNNFHVDLLRGDAYSPRAQVFAMYADRGDRAERYSQMTALFFSQMQQYADTVSFCRNGEDARSAFVAGKCAAFLSVEGAELLDCSLERLNEAADMGVRAVNLTWNYENLLSGSNAEGAEKGLTEQGRAFVRACGRLNIAVDVSHISDKGFWDVLEFAEGPVIASHSNLRSICPHPRNLTDEMFAALCQYGGTAGLNLYSRFLGDAPDLETVYRHIERFLALGGDDHIGIGSDFDGMDSMPSGIYGVQDIRLLWEYLGNRGYSYTVLKKLFFSNFMRIFE